MSTAPTNTATKAPTSHSAGPAGDPCKVLTGEFRLSFPNLFEPKANDQGQLKYSLTMLFPKTADLSAMKKAASAAGEKKWGTDRTKWPRGYKNPFRDGDEKEYDGYKDHIFVGASSESKPGVVDQAVKPVTDPAKVYAGCYCRATVVAFAYEKNGNKGIAFALHNVQFLKDGAPFGSKRAASDDFAAVEVQAANPNGHDEFGPTNGGEEPPL